LKEDQMKVFLSAIICLTLSATSSKLFSQGCVAVRGSGGSCMLQNETQSKGWQFATSSRYFRSYKHFRGKHEEKNRVEENTEVINHQFTLDLLVSRNFNNRFSIAAGFPIISNTRSSKYEHYGNSSSDPNARHTTKAFGMGDLRVTGYYWLIDPKKSHKGNIQAGLGIKLPTGDYKVMDHFYKSDGSILLGPVDQSIQLGDGGTGFITELNAFYNPGMKTSIYANFFYLINPREHNGVSTARGGTSSTSSIQNGSDVMSVPDQYMIRAGLSYSPGHKSTLSIGLREECIPVRDLVGGSNGFRRPGYIISLEPSFAFHFKRSSAFISVPVALVRNRTQSVPDKIRTDLTGNYTQGDAAFADYLISAGFSIKL